MLPTLHTARATLVPATADDVDALWALFTDPIVRRYLWDDAPISREQAAETVSAATAQADEGRGLWTIRTGEIVGCVALLAAGAAARFEPRMAGGVELLVALAPRAQRQGLAHEALTAVIEYAWRELDLAELFAAVDEPNEASHRAMLRAGFARLGESDGPRHRLRSYRIARRV